MKGKEGEKAVGMEEIFGYVWLIILAVLYIKKWGKVLADIRKTKEQYGRSASFQHLSPASRKWIKWHIIILFLWSLGEWKG